MIIKYKSEPGLFMSWTVPRWRKSVVVHSVVFRWLWSALAINLTDDSPTNDSEIAVDSTLDTSGGFYGTYFSKRRNLFLCLLKRQSLDKSWRRALTKRDVIIFLEKLKLTYIHCNCIHNINVLFRWTDALYLCCKSAFFKPFWFYTIYFNLISCGC